MQRSTCSTDEIRREDEITGRFDLPACMDDAYRDRLLLSGKASKIGFGADGREGAAVNLRAVADIVECGGQLAGPWVCIAAISRR